ncbi:FixH family protein [Bosea psychrotolerans]|uniref:Nitrogen fixation protein FixH n=1 Tax=Bosea psychrotolerans TaxID=1871628 RepID=A0A2S4MLQ3_9HYPH|nr:FixH family protein [Bosea psychrotolerans]POR55529.1 nitrogen fixation protein FixH [Bosea psychrotolerans]
MPIDLPAQPARQRPPFELSGRMVLFAMVAFFAVVAGVNAIMMTAAIRTMPGVDVKSAYETSQRFNGEIARMHAQAERGWQAQARVERKGDGATVTLNLRDHSGVAVVGLGVEAKLQHPASRQEDREANLVEIAPGLYTAQIPTLHRGAWTLAVEAKRDTETLFISRSRIQLVE